MDFEDFLFWFFIGLLFFLFQGNPDIWDLLQAKVMHWLQ